MERYTFLKNAGSAETQVNVVKTPMHAPILTKCFPCHAIITKSPEKITQSEKKNPFSWLLFLLTH